MPVEVERFGRSSEGTPVRRFRLSRGALTVELIEYGASLTRVRAPDRAGRPGDVVLGFGTLAAYESDPAHFGAVPGRFANRIAQGRCRVGQRWLRLPVNHGAHHLHGGPDGFGRRVWSGQVVERDGVDGVRFELSSADGDAGYPGRLTATATYWLRGGGELAVALRAETDAPTPVNLTQHAYFHLGDGGATPIEDHVLRIDAQAVLEMDAGGIPTGARTPVAGTPFDFRAPTRLGDRLVAVEGSRGGFDHCFALASGGSGARVVDPGSGRTLDVETNQPGLQLYTANALDGSLASPDGIPYGRWHALCLEPQAFPDAPNHPEFPSAVLLPGERYVHDSLFRFGVEDS